MEDFKEIIANHEVTYLILMLVAFVGIFIGNLLGKWLLMVLMLVMIAYAPYLAIKTFPEISVFGLAVKTIAFGIAMGALTYPLYQTEFFEMLDKLLKRKNPKNE